MTRYQLERINALTTENRALKRENEDLRAALRRQVRLDTLTTHRAELPSPHLVFKPRDVVGGARH